MEDSDSKQIKINGTTTRYKIKKCITNYIPQPLHKITNKDMLNCICQNKLDDGSTSQLELLNNPTNNILHLFTNKLNGYKYQDKLKNFNNDKLKLITNQHVVDLLVSSDCKCYYCQQDVAIIYNYVRTKNQWTLDRIDNNIGHVIDNIVIACLQCNLQRRKKEQKPFLFTKRLVLEKNK